MIEEDMEELKQMQPISANQHKSWKGHGWYLSGNNTGPLYLYGDKDTAKILKVYDVNGREKRCIQVDNHIYQVIGFNGRFQDMLVIRTGKRHKNIELRDAMDPSVILDTMSSSHHARCQPSPNTIILANYIDEQSTAVEYEITEGKFDKLKKEINIPLKNVYAIASVSHDDRKLLVMTSWEEQTIIALDYNTLDEVWRLKDVECDGKVIRPHGICSDGAGHLFVADGINKRILTLNTDGTGLRKLTDTESIAADIVWIALQRKLVVSNSTDYMIRVYNVKYTRPTKKRNFVESTLGSSDHKRAHLAPQQQTLNLAEGTPSTSQE